MLKFFRRIRRKLLSESKFSKYLIYAIGEILLVVIGILLALQINNWNENRKNSILEKSYIKELRADFKKDSIAIDKLLNDSNKQVSSKYKLQKFLKEYTDSKFNTSLKDYPAIARKVNYNKDSIYDYWVSQWSQIYKFTPITTTIDEMKSTGKIGIITNKKLRQSIIETYNKYDYFLSYYQENYSTTLAENRKMLLDDIPELYLLSDESILELFQNKRVLNRFNANFVLTMNRGFIELQDVNLKLLNALNEWHD